jgi:hypothetical protein
MPNPLAQFDGSVLVSDWPAQLNANGAARHSLGVTALTDADDGYVVVDDDEALELTIAADTGVVLPDPSTCAGRSIYVLLATAAGFDLNLTATGGANINGGATLTLSTDWTGKRLVSRGTYWVAI